MVTKEQLEQGLEWISGKTKISVHSEVHFISSSIYVYLYPNYPNEQNDISLCISINEKRVEIVDLKGNGSSSDFQKQGYGRLIVNTGIQAVYAFLEMSLDEPKANELTVFGRTSNTDDPHEEPGRTEGRNRRNRFWTDTGLILKDPESFNTKMETTLDKLQIRDGAVISNGISRIIDLETFWLKGNAPTLYKSDIQALMAIDTEKLNLKELPSRNEIDAAWNNSRIWKKIIKKSIFLILSVVFVYGSVTMFEPVDAIICSIFGFFVSYVLSVLLVVYGFRLSPYQLKYDKLSSLRGKILTGIKDYILEIEGLHNGFFWRLYPGIKDYGILSDKVFRKMETHSKELYAFILADDYKKEYIQFVEIAKKIIVERGLDEHF